MKKFLFQICIALAAVTAVSCDELGLFSNDSPEVDVDPSESDPSDLDPTEARVKRVYFEFSMTEYDDDEENRINQTADISFYYNNEGAVSKVDYDATIKYWMYEETDMGDYKVYEEVVLASAKIVKEATFDYSEKNSVSVAVVNEFEVKEGDESDSESDKLAAEWTLDDDGLVTKAVVDDGGWPKKAYTYTYDELSSEIQSVALIYTYKEGNPYEAEDFYTWSGGNLVSIKEDRQEEDKVTYGYVDTVLNNTNIDINELLLVLTNDLDGYTPEPELFKKRGAASQNVLDTCGGFHFNYTKATNDLITKIEMFYFGDGHSGGSAVCYIVYE